MAEDIDAEREFLVLMHDLWDSYALLSPWPRYRPTPFGELVDERRKKEKLSIRALAAKLGLTHVALGNLIRGKTLVLDRAYWPGLEEQLGLTELELQRAAGLSQGREIGDAPSPGQALRCKADGNDGHGSRVQGTKEA